MVWAQDSLDAESTQHDGLCGHLFEILGCYVTYFGGPGMYIPQSPLNVHEIGNMTLNRRKQGSVGSVAEAVGCE